MPEQENQTLRVGSRESQLAMLQTLSAIELLVSRFPNLCCEVKAVTTRGDRVLNMPIAEVGSRGVFVKELEEALLANEVDLVVHSLKDLPTDLPAGLTVAAVFSREDPRDVLVSRDNIPFQQLASGSRVATSSLRRASQLRALRSDLTFVDIRGNITTRLRKHDEGACEAMVLAAAGLLRLGMAHRIAEYLEPDISTPAAGQGALAVECREDDHNIVNIVKQIDDSHVRAQTTAERSFLDYIGGGCSVPIGVLCTTLPTERLALSACVAALDGSRVLRKTMEAIPAQAVDLGVNLAKVMLALGAQEILDSIRGSTPSTVSPP